MKAPFNVTQPNFVAGLEPLAFLPEKAPTHTVETFHGPIEFTMFGVTTEFRVRTFFTKEPETLAWIDSFELNDVFWDIGANIGCYSLYAARSRKVHVLAFEPSPANFYLLTANSYLNQDFLDHLELYPFALTNNSGIKKWTPDVTLGSADNQLSVARGPLAVQAYTIDELVLFGNCQPPTHLKIDVDGIEDLILAGAEKTLASDTLKSIMIEVDERQIEAAQSLRNNLISLGFQAPIVRHKPYWDKNHYLPFSNWLFRRKANTD